MPAPVGSMKRSDGSGPAVEQLAVGRGLAPRVRVEVLLQRHAGQRLPGPVVPHHLRGCRGARAGEGDHVAVAQRGHRRVVAEVGRVGLARPGLREDVEPIHVAVVVLADVGLVAGGQQAAVGQVREAHAEQFGFQRRIPRVHRHQPVGQGVPHLRDHRQCGPQVVVGRVVADQASAGQQADVDGDDRPRLQRGPLALRRARGGLVAGHVADLAHLDHPGRGIADEARVRLAGRAAHRTGLEDQRIGPLAALPVAHGLGPGEGAEAALVGALDPGVGRAHGLRDGTPVGVDRGGATGRTGIVTGRRTTAGSQRGNGDHAGESARARERIDDGGQGVEVHGSAPLAARPPAKGPAARTPRGSTTGQQACHPSPVREARLSSGANGVTVNDVTAGHVGVPEGLGRR